MSEYLNELKIKFDYDDNLLKAIEITINLMIEKYGVESQSEIYNLFSSIPIFAMDEVSQEKIDEIDERNKVYNPHIKQDKSENLYLSNSCGACYSYYPVFDVDMKVIGEIKYIVVHDMKEKSNGKDYLKLFGTSINMPDFIHEVNHAYAMMHPEYKYDGNKVISKHGMHTSTYEYVKNADGKYIVKENRSNDVILEEMVNEKLTQDMLVNFFKVDSFEKVSNLLDEINHLSSNYNSILMTLGKKLEILLGSQKMMEYRRNNETSIINEFNDAAYGSEIFLEYVGDNIPYDYFKEKVFELYELTVNKYNFSSREDYGYELAKVMIEAFAPLMAYQEGKYKNTSLEEFNKIRDNILSQYQQYQKVS